jgi:hypothetical protein
MVATYRFGSDRQCAKLSKDLPAEVSSLVNFDQVVKTRNASSINWVNHLGPTSSTDGCSLDPAIGACAATPNYLFAPPAPLSGRHACMPPHGITHDRLLQCYAATASMAGL